ncbi:MAG: oligosaccharide flippase family protein [Succiniclasticum sp.]|uniref:lipopolysaccharide biosynthesis protein n=1 Tax=Succiniclasticum sp. TaxID=2775030 RepID=UPI002A910528|nr:oligosaccharide flippase family protein [Succiniclasticum sp.]MDY6291073.1 oligosaccharide flippase family protein [Succiniclasticum sp.]
MRIQYLLARYDNLSKPTKASLWFIACYVIQRGLQFFSMPIYTRIMSTAEYGTYSVFFSWFNLLCVFSSMNIYAGTFNKAMIKYEERRDSYISSIQWLTLLISVLFSATIVIFNKWITDKTGFSLKLQLLLCLHLISFPSLQYWSQKQRFLFEYKKLVFITLINSVISLVLGIASVLITAEKAFSLIAVTVGVQTIINGIIFFSLMEKGKTVFNKEFWSWTLLMALPLIPHYLSEILLGHADRLMINQMFGPSKAGIYNIVYQISMVMTIIRTGINGSYAPWLYYSLKTERYKDICKVSRMIAVLMSVITLLFMLIGPEILKLAAPPAYYEAVIGIPAIMIGGFYIFIYVLFMYIEVYYEKAHFVAIASIIAAIINVMLNYVFLNLYGYISAAYTTMFSYMVMAFIHYLFFSLIQKNKPELSLVYDVKFLFMLSVFLLIAGGILIEIYPLSLIRWCIIFILLGMVILKRHKIESMLKVLKTRE